ncbi:hypothetical protein CLV63_10213 [Murinocardiopsis flavida]|uniref:LPXTG-motif cell wall-anchored protein n=1 Tax=Murinocardiopsis flavida TaxID=645275 RepID=A0A2P8DRP3_9ACTN|nr:hypothetical protein [Murinocardiopsis flavida]PSK99886.1 hypothetical protein CLV63_10213 [Murinocardiopsis flavida]
MSLRLLITAAITGLVLALPGAATAQESGPGGVPAAGDPCDPAVDMEYAVDADGRDLACGADGAWALVGSEEAPGDTGASEEPPAPEPEPAEPPPDDEPGADLDGTPCEEGADAPGEPGAWVCAPVLTEECETTGHVYRAVGDDGAPVLPAEQAAWDEACNGAQPGAGESAEPPASVPEEVPDDEAPGTECGESTEGDTSGGVVCVCLDGDYGWYHAGSWYFYQDIWYWSHGGHYWYFADGSWLRAGADAVAGIEDAASAPAPAAPKARPVADKSVYLPLTGAPLAGFVLAALALAGAGGAAWWLARRRRTRAGE